MAIFVRTTGVHLMMDVSQSIQRVRTSTWNAVTRKHIAPTMMPSQTMLVTPPGGQSARLMVGVESLRFQGFPEPKIPAHASNALQCDIAGNMVTLPVLLALVSATLAAVPWRDTQENVDEVDVDEALQAFALCAGTSLSDTPAEPSEKRQRT